MTDIESKIAEYRPNESGVELLKQTKVILLVGITGAGKNTVLNEMLRTGEFHDLITSVTREPRMNNGVMERDGVDYYFLSEAEAIELMDAGEYVEVSPVHGRIYGVTVDEVRRVHDTGKSAIADIDVQGVAKYKKLSDNVVAIFLLPPNYEEWRRRVQERYPTEDEFLADWPNRRDSAVTELGKAVMNPYYHFVINDQLDETVDACLKIANNPDTFHRKDDEKRLMARDLLEDIQAHA